MILTCPSCGTQYVVKDDAIPPGGRQVRCASCKHSWHQNPETAEEPREAIAAEPTPAQADETEVPAGGYSEGEHSDAEESLAEATLIEPRSGPEAEERAYEETELDTAEGPPPTESAETAVASDPYANAQFDIGKRDAPEGQPESDWREPPDAEAAGDEFTPFPAPDELEARKGEQSRKER